MNAFLSYVLNSLLVCVEVFALFQLGCCFFKSAAQKWKQFALFLALIVAHIIVLLFSQGLLPLKVALFIVIDLFWLRIVFRPQILKCFLISVLFSAFMLLGDSIIHTGLTILLTKDPSNVLQNPYAYYAFCFAVKIVELLFIALFRAVMRTRSSFAASSWRDWLRVIAFPLTSTVVVLVLLSVFAESQQTSLQIMICCVFLTFADLLSIVLLNYIDSQQQKLHDYSILKHSMKSEKDSVDAWMDAYAMERRHTHEYQNQLETIRGLAQNNEDNNELISYVSQLLHAETKGSSGSLPISTGRAVADVILSRKNEIAKSKDIQFIANLDYMRDFPLPDDALSVVMSNLIDNAIEASEKVEDPNLRKIVLNIRVEPEVSFFYIENHTSQPVAIVNNQVATTKEDTVAHGYGLRNVAAIMEQYHAYYVLDYQPETSTFCFSAQFTP